MPFDPKAIARRIKKVQDEIQRGLIGNEGLAVKEVLELLKRFQAQIRTALTSIDSEKFTAFHLSRMNQLIDDAIHEFQIRAGQVVVNRSTLAAKSGQDVWIKTTAAWGGDNILVAPILSDSMLAVITAMPTELIKGLSEEVASKTKAVLQRAVLGTQTPFQAMKHVSEIVGSRGNTGAFYSAERIVRTEMGRAYNTADQLIGNKIADARGEHLPQLMKAWISVLSPTTRDSHREAHKQVVPYDEPFIVDGEELDYPLDPNGSPGNTINCKCFKIVAPEDQMEDQLAMFP